MIEIQKDFLPPATTESIGGVIIGDNLTIDEQGKLNTEIPLIKLEETSGTIILQVNKVYTISINGQTTFSLPIPENRNIFNQIKVMARITGTPSINWGTTNYFNNVEPTIEEGDYDFYFDYDELNSVWVVGSLLKGTSI